MIYEGVSPPLTKRFHLLNKTEAMRYFDWFIRIIPERIDMLRKACIFDGVGDILDYTPESLVPLWRWYLGDVKIEELPQEEYEARLAAVPDYLKEEIGRYEIARGYRLIVWDISIYFAECMLRACPKISWGIVFKPKNYISVNRPVLVGFEHDQDLDTHQLVQIQMQRILDIGSDEGKLLHFFNIWRNKAPKLV